MPGRAVTEAARELETFTYESALLANTICNDVANLISSSNLRPSKDGSLTALAQVAALRLNASRALISLFDRQYQHVIAEATQGLRICDGPPSDRLWLCGTAVPRSSGLCENVLHPSDPDSPLREARAAKLPVTVVDDLLEHEEFRDEWYCQGWPRNRFYAGVPIRSRRGINIGVLCVLDDKPRKGIGDASVQVLQDLSEAILQHLETRRSGDAHRPGHRMLRGLGSYVEGRATMSDWENQGPNASQDMQATDAEGLLNRAQQDLQRERDSLSDINFADATEPLDRLPAPILPGKGPHEPYSSMAIGSGPTTTDTTKTPPASDPDGRLRQIQQIFSRAANILRESVEVEGVLFLGAGTPFTGSANPGTGHTPHRQSRSGPLISSSSDSEESPRTNSTERQTDSVETVCDVIGFSTSKSSSIDAAYPRQSHQIVPQRFLQRLLRRYPRGKIFNFDGQGSLIPSDGSSSEEGSAKARTAQHEEPGNIATGPKQQSPKREKTVRYRENESKTITNLFPGARSLCFIPLWDSHRRRWFAGGFVYTMTPFRVFTLQGELSYLSAFAAVIMSDFALMESAFATSAVSSLLSSLSHELRSPLHGIVLCTELLHDTSLDVFQGDMLRSLETCGRTLLDTINHLLDWTKINNFIKGSGEDPASQNQRMIRGGHKASAADGIMHLTSHLELDCLIEEVVECIHAGHTYQQRAVLQGTQADVSSNPHARLDAADDLSDTGSPIQRHSHPLIIMLDIEPMLEWTFEAQAGALRRIILNICSNALRYTDQGFVKIVAYQEPHVQPGSPNRTIHIDFVDTGRGMGSDYLGQSLFNPFSKENVHSPGAGLGLSLVQKFIKALGGTIRVQSELNKGTNVSVKLPLKASTGRGAGAADGRSDFDAQVAELSRLRVCLMGFPTAQRSLLSSAAGGAEEFDEQALLSKICQDWLQMDVVGSGQDEGFMPDLILCDESAVSKLNCRSELSSPVIIVCRNPAAARDLERAHMKHKLTRGLYSFISRPVGPRKLAKAFVLCFRRWTRLQARFAEEGHSMATSIGEEASTLGDNPQQASGQLDEAGAPHPDTLPQAAPALQPASDDDPTLRSVTPTPTSKAGGGRFLLVEDNVINMKILKTYMKKLGRAFDTAADGRQAVDMYKSRGGGTGGGGGYACVLMDVSMPVMDGFEATRLIREFERREGQGEGQGRRGARAHVVAITGLASRDAQEEALAAGVDLFLSKPVRLKELSRLLRERGLV